MWLAKQSLRNFLDFTRYHWQQLFPSFLNKKFLAFQWSKESYLILRLSWDIWFVIPLEFHLFDVEIYYVVLRTSLWIHWHLCGTDSLDFISGFHRWQSFYPLLTKEPKIFVSLQIKASRSQYNTIHCLTYYKQSYCKDIQIYVVFDNHEG